MNGKLVFEDNNNETPMTMKSVNIDGTEFPMNLDELLHTMEHVYDDYMKPPREVSKRKGDDELRTDSGIKRRAIATFGPPGNVTDGFLNAIAGNHTGGNSTGGIGTYYETAMYGFGAIIRAFAEHSSYGRHVMSHWDNIHKISPGLAAKLYTCTNDDGDGSLTDWLKQCINMFVGRNNYQACMNALQEVSTEVANQEESRRVVFMAGILLSAGGYAAFCLYLRIMKRGGLPKNVQEVNNRVRDAPQQVKDAVVQAKRKVRGTHSAAPRGTTAARPDTTNAEPPAEQVQEPPATRVTLEQLLAYGKDNNTTSPVPQSSSQTRMTAAEVKALRKAANNRG